MTRNKTKKYRGGWKGVIPIAQEAASNVTSKVSVSGLLSSATNAATKAYDIVETAKNSTIISDVFEKVKDVGANVIHKGEEVVVDKAIQVATAAAGLATPLIVAAEDAALSGLEKIPQGDDLKEKTTKLIDFAKHEAAVIGPVLSEVAADYEGPINKATESLKESSATVFNSAVKVGTGFLKEIPPVSAIMGLSDIVTGAVGVGKGMINAADAGLKLAETGFKGADKIARVIEDQLPEPDEEAPQLVEVPSPLIETQTQVGGFKRIVNEKKLIERRIASSIKSFERTNTHKRNRGNKRKSKRVRFAL